MNVLVTGAGGFLGRAVVDAILNRGHRVRAMIRPAGRADESLAATEIIRADLRNPGDLTPALDGIDVVVHLAAATSGDDEGQFASTVNGTERLLEAVRRASVRRLVLCSSFAVYSFAKAHRRLDEQTPLEGRIYSRGAYDVAKWWQERIVREAAREGRWELTVLRPGFIWGEGHTQPACLGRALGPLFIAIAPFSRIPLTHVENCADAFARVVDDPQTSGKTYNVVDDDNTRAWRLLSENKRRGAIRGVRLPVPYRAWMAVARLARLTSRMLFHGRGKLPAFLMPNRVEAMHKPLRYPTRLHQELAWRPPLSFAECVERSFPARRSEAVQLPGLQHA